VCFSIPCNDEYLNVYVQERWYIFEPSELHSAVQRSLAATPNDTRAVIDGIVSSLRETHPEHAISQTEEWVFSNAGGAMGAMYIVHASITEYAKSL
jgi:C-8 sterol isomerase